MNLEVANRLQQLRKAKGLSQEELAHILGLSRQAISKWERAETSPDTDNLICLARLYNISIDKLLDTSESTEEIKERIAQERIDEINNKKEDSYFDDSNKEEDKTIISEEDIALNDELKESRKKRDEIVNTMYSATLVLGIITWVLIGQIDKDSWKWGWIFGVMSFGFVCSFEQMFADRTLNLIGIGFSLLVFCGGLSIITEAELNVSRVFGFIGIGIILFQIILQMILFLIYFTKNRKTASELYYKERLREIKREYEKEIEKIKSKA